MRKIFVFKKLKKDNKGAGFFTVVVAALFLMVLSAALIYSSFTAYRVKISAKKSNSAFYYADMAIEEIKTGFQKVVSDSARAGYENVLSRYTASVSQTEVFKEAYAKSFKGFKFKDSDSGLDSPLFMTNGSKITGVYTKGIKSFLSDEVKNDKLTITSVSDASNPTYLPCTSDDKGNVTIKGLKAEYTDGEYTAYITTDIKLLIPDVTLAGAYDVGGLDKYVFISDEGFDATNPGSTTTTILKSGTNAFFGEMNLDGGRSFTCEDGCTVIVGKVDRQNDYFKDGKTGASTGRTGNILISDRTNLKLGNNCTLYAQDIILSEYGELIESNDDKTYVADDLSLADESKATIYGKYIGFGNSLDEGDADSSSSVLFPKRTIGTNKATLDLSYCNDFTLAGRSYITNGRDEEGGYSDVGMGSSISSTKEQIIYLVPADYLGGGTNPTVLTGTRDDVVTQTTAKRQTIADNLTTRPLFTLKDGTKKRASDSGLTAAGNIKTLIYPVVGTNQWAVYYFFKFPTPNDSNNYFKDFFSNGSSSIMEYLNDYATIEGDAAKIYTAGTGAVKNNNNEITITEATQRDLGGISNELSQVYRNLSQTMNPQGAAVGSSPFCTLVDVKYLSDFIEAARIDPESAETTYGLDIDSVNANKNGNGHNVRITAINGDGKFQQYIVADGDCWLDNVSVNTLHLVICKGNVHITGEWRGLIICSGKIINEGCSKAELDSDYAMDEKGATIFTNSKFYTGNAVTPNDDNWNMDDQVVFENWKKNEG